MYMTVVTYEKSLFLLGSSWQFYLPNFIAETLPKKKELKTLLLHKTNGEKPVCRGQRASTTIAVNENYLHVKV